MTKLRLLTGDTPTGLLHLGHWVGSLENRVKLQDDYSCFFILANLHAFTTHAKNSCKIRQSVLDITVDYLSAGIDPMRSNIFIQSEVPAISELTLILSMLVSSSRVSRNPTLKQEIQAKNLGDNYPFGFLLYPVSQMADILAFRPDVVPVGEDQLPHIEMTREVARRFNQMYCSVSSHSSDADHLRLGGVFPVPEAKLGRVKRLVGIGAPDKNGHLMKMSKSLNNSILLSDTPDIIKKKVMSMYTDPTRLKATDLGCTENNPLWIFHETFNQDKQWVKEAKSRYRAGKIKDVDCKKKLIEVLVDLISPMREKRKVYQDDLGQVMAILREGTQKANEIAEDTLDIVKKSIHQNFF